MSEETSNPATEAGTADVVTENNGEATEQTVSYMDGRFNSVTDLEAGLTTAEKRYEDYRSMNDKRFGAFTGAPEAYELPEGTSVSDSIQAFAKENQFSNEALNGLVEVYQQDQQAQHEAYVAEQKELLGSDGEQRIQNVVDWGRANLGEESLSVLDQMISSAAGIEVFEKIAKMNTGTQAAAVQAPATTVDRDTLKSMRFAKDEFGGRKMSSDPAYRAKVEALEAQMMQNR